MVLHLSVHDKKDCGEAKVVKFLHPERITKSYWNMAITL